MLAGMAIEKPTSALEHFALTNTEALSRNPYPGRGIVMGIDSDGRHLVQVHWIMGRRDGSRNRMFVVDGTTVRTDWFDKSKATDDPNVIYTAMKSLGGAHIVSNGDQTDTIADFIEQGKTFTEAMDMRIYEPDAPHFNFTPRIAGMIDETNSTRGILAVVKKREDSDLYRHIYTHLQMLSGIGDMVHTYTGDGNPLPSFGGDPRPVTLRGTILDILYGYWDLLNGENRVALAVKTVDLVSHRVDVKVIDRHQSPQSVSAY